MMTIRLLPTTLPRESFRHCFIALRHFAAFSFFVFASSIPVFGQDVVPSDGVSSDGVLSDGVLSDGVLTNNDPAESNLISASESTSPSIESKFLSNTRQLTFEGSRAGEGYFSPDGSLMVFQSERRVDNPFFQIYLLDLETGDIDPISPGHGKTTCAWVHRDKNRVLFSSTHDDPEAIAKQRQEIEFRESGQQRRYSWDYDPNYEIYAFDRETNNYTRLTEATGYDAEASYSPNGELIAFASNRNAYAKEMSAAEQKAFEIDPAVMMDIFIMNSDGSNVRQLTDTLGYDGGPFFSADGKKICWRRFSENGVTAEIMTMNIDGSEQTAITRMGAMSWAPFYHPSGKYLVFTTNKHGFANFELYLVAADGRSAPVRVTDTDGFDGLASFSPDGKRLTWTSNRNAKKQSQIFIADWNHEAAMAALSDAPSEKVESAEASGGEVRDPAESTSTTAIDEPDAVATAIESAKAAEPDFDPRDIMRHVDYLCHTSLAGRMTGSAGERKATAYVAAYMDFLSLQPAGEKGSWFQKFEFPNGAEAGPANRLTYSINAEIDGEYKLDTDWRPLTFSRSESVKDLPVVFAGYGIVAPERDGHSAYDSYGELDVKDKWVLVFRFIPEDISPERRQHLQFYGSLRKKVFYAREKGAAGLIVVSGPTSAVREQLVPLQNDFSPAGSSMAAISIHDELASGWFKSIGKDLRGVQAELDSGKSTAGFELGDLRLSAELDIKKIVGTGRNVVGRLQAGTEPSQQYVIVGAHIDHLGLGKTGGSLAKESESGGIHFGADDNASGVAAMLEIAEYLVTQQRLGKLELKHDVVFAGWSGEELGLHGSKHYADAVSPKAAAGQTPGNEKKANFHDFNLGIDEAGELSVNGESMELEELEKSLDFIGKNAPDFEIKIIASGNVTADQVDELKALLEKHEIKKIAIEVVESKPNRTIIAALNMDMIGRLEDKLILQGISSSDVWPGLIETKNAVVGLPLTLSDDTDLPTDASSFYQAGVPILSAFTGSHRDYHTPRDTPDKLNYPDAARIARLMGLITRSLATAEEIPNYQRVESKPKMAARGGGRAYLGSVPSYGDDVVGVKLSDVTKGAPADVAGVKGGDIIVGLAGKKIENIYDYTAIIDALKVGQETVIEIERGGQKIELKITPTSRQ